MPLSLKERKSFLVLGLLLALHLVLISVQVPFGAERTLFERAAFTVFSPFQRLFSAAAGGFSDAWRNNIGLRRARAENQRLKKDLFFLSQKNAFLLAELAAARSQDKARAALEGFRRHLITGRVIGVDAANVFSSVTINKGRHDGVVPNLAVCDRNGFLIGRTIEPISRRESRVQLITDDDSGVAVIVEGGGASGILSGDSRTGTCRLKYILATDPRGEKGQVLLTTGHDGIFPPGIRVGVIESVDSGGVLFKTVDVRPFFKMSALDVVAVLGTKTE
ncbi:MAG: rod shape-determining protein MreC [Acidobacteriota bacterium]|nr:rod shape-determining protein MreC [Acidobacteriota bacterium]